MIVYLFFVFPNDDETLSEFASNNGCVEEIIKSINAVKSHLTSSNLDFVFCYDSGQLASFIEALSVIEPNKNVISKANAIRMILAKNSCDINRHNIADKSHLYAKWSLNAKSLIIYPIPELFQNLCCYDSPGVYSFVSNQDNDAFIHIIEDAVQESNLPRLLNIPLFICPDDCIEWIKANYQGKFSLSCNQFVPTTYRWIKQRIYKEIKTGCFWYPDFFHKANGCPHYEVFDSTGAHIGEADLDGKYIQNSKDSQKSISQIIR